MARTRSKPGPKGKPKETTPETTTTTTKSLPPSTSNPPKLFILPKDASKDARIVTLDNPATDTPSRYFFCPQKGFHEFTRICAPKKDSKSWLITSDDVDEQQTEEEKNGRIGSGYITKTADMFIATPIDLLFLILSALALKNAKDTKQHFLALEDYLDKLASSSQHWRALMAHFPSLKDMLEKRMGAICDSVDAGDEKMYRISHEKLLTVLLSKAERMIKNGLPPSLEEKFLKHAFDVPVMNIKREDSSLSGVDTTTSEPATEAAGADQDSQTSASTATDSQSSANTTITTPDTELIPEAPALTTPPEFPRLLRVRTCLTYLFSTYLPPSLRAPLQSLLSKSTSHDFAALDAHLAQIAKLKSEAAALRSISDNVTRKRAYEDDEEKIAEREEKKRKKEEEERKKKSEGRGIKALKKADTSGMKKMSAFFTKVPKKA